MAERYRPSAVLAEAESKDRLYDSVDSVRVFGRLGVEGLYTGLFVPFDGVPNADPSQDLYNNGASEGLSQEHVFPAVSRGRGHAGRVGTSTTYSRPGRP